MYDATSVSLGNLVLISNSPEISVDAPTLVPLNEILTKGRSSFVLASITLPETLVTF